MEYVLKTKRIRKKTKHWRESMKLSSMPKRKFIRFNAFDDESYILERRK